MIRFLVLVFGLLAAELHLISRAQNQNSPSGRGRGGLGRFNTEALIAGQLISQGDKNDDAELTKDELTTVVRAWFERLDSSGTGRVSQEDFLSRFGHLLQASQSSGRRSGGRPGFGPNPYLGLFVAIDTDKDSTITREEFNSRFESWFEVWDAVKSGNLDREKLADGLSSILPRTNLGRGTARQSTSRLPGLPEPPPSPVLPPEEAAGTLKLADGFKVQRTASEPSIEDPIALTFDENGRLYVLEMRGFMLDIDRAGERDPIGRITLLENLNEDGQFEKSTVFLDGLIIPRSISAVHGGVFYVSDYKLYFAKDTNQDGKADQNELVDASYGRGNVEHAPNGFMPAMDNWIYNARSPYRYRCIGGVLLKQRTENRGQWGITQDNYGRLLYNVNNSQLLGDFTPPNYMGRNPHHPTSSGLNLFVSTDQRVFTIRMNTAINRGYLREVLDNSGKAFVFASSCSPVIYRGDNYPAEFIGNAFVCDPAVNLIKRNLVFDRDLTLSSKFAYKDSEFLASTDERFRPVNLFNGPDGALWIVDMYRGAIQYSAFITPYLRRETLERGLDKGIHYGRIYRIVSTNKTPSAFPKMSNESSPALVARLSHPNGWIRDTAQRLLVERRDRSVLPNLIHAAQSGQNTLGRIHALWTMEGLLATLPEGMPSVSTRSSAEPSVISSNHSVRLVDIDTTAALGPETPDTRVLDASLAAIRDDDPKVQVAAIRVAESLTRRNADRQETLLGTLSEIQESQPAEVAFQAALSAGNLSKPASLPVMIDIATRLSAHSLIRDAILSGLQNWELQFLQILLADPRWAGSKPGYGALLQSLAAAVMNEGNSAKVGMLLNLAANQPEERGWCQESMLLGIASLTQNRRFEPIRLVASPSALDYLERSARPAVREQIQGIAKLFSWPGHQDDAVSETRNPQHSANPADDAITSEGGILFEQLCAACHGLGGEGIRPLAPPLANSEWIHGSENRLIRIVLNGVTGPIHVDGITYEPPLTLPDMPALREALSDSQIAAVLNFVRGEWGEATRPVSSDQVEAIRVEDRNREFPWTEEELLQIQ